MLVRTLLTLAIGALLVTPLSAQNREDKVRNDKKRVEAEGYWFYNDLPGAFAKAKQSGKPIIVVLRCLPCVECVKLDDELIDGDARVKPLLEQFVRVRVVGTNGLDLSLFQFDTDQSFAVFLLNADGTIYGRFGTRSHRTDWLGDVSIDGLAKALEGTLALHKAYPANKASLAAKRGPAPEFASPEKFPSLKEKYKSTLNYEGNVVQSCIHCHQIGDAVRELAVKSNEKLADEVLFPYPHPKSLGLILDPKEMATVASVTPGSDAEKAGFRAGDAIRQLGGQPLVSMADVQWVLHRTSPDGAVLKADVVRDGKPLQLSLQLASGWRHRDDISWRTSSWQLRRVAFGGMLLMPLPEEERAKWNLPPNSTALLVQHVGQYPPHNLAQRAGVQKGDILLKFDGHSDLLRESDLLAYSLQQRPRGEQLPITVLRGGEKKDLKIAVP